MTLYELSKIVEGEKFKGYEIEVDMYFGVYRTKVKVNEVDRLEAFLSGLEVVTIEPKKKSLKIKCKLGKGL